MKSLAIAIVAALALGACASGPTLPDDQLLSLYQAHAGKPVNKFHHYGTLDRWVPLGDSALSVWLRPNTAYLLTLASDCPDLEYARTISLGDQSGSVFAGLDNVTECDNESAHGKRPDFIGIRVERHLDPHRWVGS